MPVIIAVSSIKTDSPFATAAFRHFSLAVACDGFVHQKPTSGWHHGRPASDIRTVPVRRTPMASSFEWQRILL
jgi:hypothetical protein